MSGRLLTGLVNGLLCGIGSYGCYRIDPYSQPFGFASCVVACSRGILGLLRVYHRDTERILITTKRLSYRSVLQVGHITLINLGLYRQAGCQRSSILFGLCLAPLVYCLAIVPGKSIWLDLMTGVNIISLLHLIRVERSWCYFVMAYLTLLSSYGSDYMKECGYKDTEEPITCLSLTCIALLSIKAMA